MNAYYKRRLIIDLPPKQSAFLWGARRTGKSSFLKKHFPDSLYYDFLQSDLYARLSKEPHLFREEILALSAEALKRPIIVDEVQKIPALLDEVHWLIENTEAQFILCGSSARKLKKAGANLLGGRAWSYHLYPLVFPEIDDFDLLKVLTHGAIPSHYNSRNIKKSLNAYIHDYLTFEIQAEGLVRNLPAFSRFLDTMGFSNGEMTNYTNIARDCGVDAKTVKEYYQILVDTLLGYYLPPYDKRVGRDIISSTPKFYLLDVGVANALAKQTIETLSGPQAGRAFEHFIFSEMVAYFGYEDLKINISYWRTKTGLEVDFILGEGRIAIEVKITDHVQKNDAKGLVAFALEHKPNACYIVSREPRKRKITENGVEILILPYQEFLAWLWEGKIIMV